MLCRLNHFLPVSKEDIMNNALSTIALLALLGGCASTNTADTAERTDMKAATVTVTDEELREQEILCTREMRTGSHRTSRTCRTFEQRKREREAAAEVLRNTQNGGQGVVN